MKEFIESLWSVWSNVFGGVYLMLIFAITCIVLYLILKYAWQKNILGKRFNGLFKERFDSIFKEKAATVFRTVGVVVLILTMGFLFFNMFSFGVGEFIVTFILALLSAKIYKLLISLGVLAAIAAILIAYGIFAFIAHLFLKA